ncbi:MAG: hypothetical protein KDE19_15350 [Caldilineaceae bacterium]|nr:hypothetical protein [Caldilineaceae bacterium]
MRRIIVLAFVAMALFPVPAYACSGFFDCMFGWSERTDIRAERDTELARIQAERDRQVADISALAQERVKAAEAQVEQVKQQRYASEAARDVAIAQAQAQADEYKAMVAALSSEKIAGINADAQTQITALQEAGKIHVEGITQTGLTERFRITGGWVFAALCVLIIGGLLRLLVNRQREHDAYVRMIENRPRQQLDTEYHPAYIEVLRQRREVVRYEED